MIEDLAANDLVSTLDHGNCPLLWTFHKRWSAEQIARNPALRVVCIRAGALGPNMPARDLRVSQHHRILVSGKVAMRMFGASEILVPAKAFLSLPGVSLDSPDKGVTYFHLMLAQHEVLISEGLPAESLYLGNEASKALSTEARTELVLLLGHQINCIGAPHPARTLVPVRRGCKLVARHARNRQPFIQPNVYADRLSA